LRVSATTGDPDPLDNLEVFTQHIMRTTQKCIWTKS
jgi:hypothetical protein